MVPTSIDLRGRRDLLRACSAVALAGLGGAPVQAHSERNLVSVWKRADCGCCKQWVRHLEGNGFRVVAADVADPAQNRAELRMPDQYGGCHTAVVEDYVIEGHVPAVDIHRLLRQRPRALGLAVPGMPVGSPGMEMGTKRAAYQVLLVLVDGTSRVFQRYAAKN